MSRAHTHVTEDFAAIVGRRGYVVLYRRQSGTECPGCGGRNWSIGRSSAECGFCGLALPLAEPVNPENFFDQPTERKN